MRGAVSPPQTPPKRPGLYKVRASIRNMEHSAHMTGNPGPSLPRKNDTPRRRLAGMQLTVPVDQEAGSGACQGNSGSWGEGDGKGSAAARGIRLADFPVPLGDRTFTGTFLPSRVILTLCPARIPNSNGSPPLTIKSNIAFIEYSSPLVVPKIRFHY